MAAAYLLGLESQGNVLIRREARNGSEKTQTFAELAVVHILKGSYWQHGDC
jgi:hypothetical protein